MGRKKTEAVELPLIPLRGITVFPIMSFSFDIGREKSIKALLESEASEHQRIFLVTQKNPGIDDPGEGDIYDVGVIIEMKQLLRMPGDTIRTLGEGISKAKILKMTGSEPCLTASVRLVKDEPYKESEHTEALARTAVELYEEYARLSMNQSPESIYAILTETNLHSLSDMIMSNIGVKYQKKQQALEMTNALDKINFVIGLLEAENNVLEIQKGIYSRVRENVDKNQKEYFLKEQMKAIRDELGAKDGFSEEAEQYKNKISALDMPEESRGKLLKDVERLTKMQPHSSEYSVLSAYLDLAAELPWNIRQKERFDIERIEKILESEHFGLNKIKERIIEYIAVRKAAGKGSTPILCLSGPPGTGKTSVARSIAKSLNRKYVRMSLGGVHDEAEIRGHRKTYVGAMPGRIITAVKQAKSSNPVILLDEIDKISKDAKGDPSSALLEALDAEQNNSFRDNYLEIPFDLSDIIFICTANQTDAILPALKDRLEIIEVSGYDENEKLNIAEKFLFPKQLKMHGLTKKQLKISRATFREIINRYTKEAGVRKLERQIGRICRRRVLALVKGENGTASVSANNLEAYLGIPRYNINEKEEKPAVGVAKGLAVTGAGGETLSIEVNTMKGTGKFELTGNMGDVMKESAKAAISYIRSNAAHFSIDEKFYKDTDIHIHIPEGAVPKDGPSAGITMAAAMISALTGSEVSNDVAMTGEITIRGNVLAVGGIKEKLLAAKRSGIKRVAAPLANKKDVEDIPREIREGLDIAYVDYMEQVLDAVLIRN